MTISNTAGFGEKVGQAIAVYAEGDRISFESCRILGHQDTLFTGPLPYKEIEKGGFKGPTEFAERKVGRQLYSSCYIEGEVDFIFGSAAATFEGCELFSLDCGKEIKVFGDSHVEEIATTYGIPLLARLPIDPAAAAACDSGKVESIDTAPIQPALDKILSL